MACILKALFPDIALVLWDVGQCQGSPWPEVRRQLCWAAKTDTASGYLFIYLRLGGNQLEAPQYKSCPSPLLTQRQMASCSASATIIHKPRGFNQSQALAHWKPQFNFSVCQSPDLCCPFLWLACLLSLIRLFALGLPLAPHPFPTPANEAQWLSIALLQVEGTNSSRDPSQAKHKQRSCPFLFVRMIPSPSQSVAASPCHRERVDKGTERSREIIFCLLLPLRPYNLIKHEPVLRIPCSSLPGTVSPRLCKLEETNPSSTWGLREEMEKDGMGMQETSSKNWWSFFRPLKAAQRDKMAWCA